MLLRRSSAPESVDGFTLLCTNAGFSPRVISEPTRMQTVLMTVAAGIGVSLAASCFRNFHQPGVTFIPIQPDPPPLDLVAVRPIGESPRRWQLFSTCFGNSFLGFRANTLTVEGDRIGAGGRTKLSPDCLSRWRRCALSPESRWSVCWTPLREGSA